MSFRKQNPKIQVLSTRTVLVTLLTQNAENIIEQQHKVYECASRSGIYPILLVTNGLIN